MYTITKFTPFLQTHTFSITHAVTESASAKSPASAKGKGTGKTTKHSAPQPKTSNKGGKEAKPEAVSEEDNEPAAAKKVKVDAPPPPGGPVEIVFSFDTTGSMYPCLTQVSALVGCLG